MYDVGRCLLSDLLSQAHMTHEDLAIRLGVARQQVGHYVNDERTMTLHIAKNIAFILNCEIDDLYEWNRVEVRTKRR